MRLHAITMTRVRSGWIVERCVYITTARQFTSEVHAIGLYSRWRLTGLISTWWAARQLAKQIGAKRGERKALGWDE